MRDDEANDDDDDDDDDEILYSVLMIDLVIRQVCSNRAMSS